MKTTRLLLCMILFVNVSESLSDPSFLDRWESLSISNSPGFSDTRSFATATAKELPAEREHPTEKAGSKRPRDAGAHTPRPFEPELLNLSDFREMTASKSSPAPAPALPTSLMAEEISLAKERRKADDMIRDQCRILNMDPITKHYFMKMFEGLSTTERMKLNAIKHLLLPYLAPHFWHLLFGALSEIDAPNRVNFATFIKDKMHEINGRTICGFIKMFKDIPSDQWARLYELKQELVVGIRPENWWGIFNALSELNPAERFQVGAFIRYKLAVMDGNALYAFIKMIKGIPHHEYTALNHHRRYLLNGLDPACWHHVLNAIELLPPVDRVNIMSLAQELIAFEFSWIERKLIINMLHKIPEANRVIATEQIVKAFQKESPLARLNKTIEHLQAAITDAAPKRSPARSAARSEASTATMPSAAELSDDGSPLSKNKKDCPVS